MVSERPFPPRPLCAGSIPTRSSPPPPAVPQIPEQVQAVGKLSYNQLVEKIITCKQASDSSLVSEGNALLPPRRPRGTAGHPQSHGGPVPVLVPVPVPAGLVAEQFLEATASQLTFHGLCELTARAREGELGVFFRNNHFSTMIKHKVRPQTPPVPPPERPAGLTVPCPFSPGPPLPAGDGPGVPA